jgi:YVTN family beta-propeller protein
MRKLFRVSSICLITLTVVRNVIATPAINDPVLAPTALAIAQDGKTLFIGCGNQVLYFDTAIGKTSNIVYTATQPSGLVLSTDEKKLFVTCVGPMSQVLIVNLAKHRITGTIAVGHTACAPVLSPDGETLYVCNQFDNDVSVIDLRRRKELCRIPVQREPVAADLTKDGAYLLVANQLPAGRADAEYEAAVVSVIDVTSRKVVKELTLPNGSGSLKEIQISRDGKYAVVTHLVSNFNRATTSVRFGWMNANALTVIDLGRMEICGTVLLDEPSRGAANPWGVAWSPDGQKVAVAHAGTHEVSIINFPLMLASLTNSSARYGSSGHSVLTYISHYEGMDPGIPFLTGGRRRIKLPPGDLGPRALVIAGQKVYTANYFSDNLSVIDLNLTNEPVETIALGPKNEMDGVRLVDRAGLADMVRKGEFYFNDADICLQGWQSCASCHPGDARVDGFNWDLLNDGIGNPKNVRSLLLAHRTPPAMFLGVRTNAEVAVRAGIKFILFTNQPDTLACALDEYLKSLKPVPSPHLVDGKLSKAARRGKTLFEGRASCADCHVPGLFTDLHSHDVGTRRTFDGPTDKFYTPTLIEVWRTAPYLHDGSAVTIRDVLTTRNPGGQHGDAAGLSKKEMDDLCEYVLSL